MKGDGWRVGSRTEPGRGGAGKGPECGCFGSSAGPVAGVIVKRLKAGRSSRSYPTHLEESTVRGFSCPPTHLPNLSHVSSGIPNATPSTAAPRHGTQPLAVGTEDGINTWANQGYRQGVTRETRHALFVTHPSTMTGTNQRQEVRRFLKATANGLSKVEERQSQTRARVPEEDLGKSRKCRKGGRSRKSQVFPLWGGPAASCSSSVWLVMTDPDDGLGFCGDPCTAGTSRH